MRRVYENGKLQSAKNTKQLEQKIKTCKQTSRERKTDMQQVKEYINQNSLSSIQDNLPFNGKAAKPGMKEQGPNKRSDNIT